MACFEGPSILKVAEIIKEVRTLTTIMFLMLHYTQVQ